MITQNNKAVLVCAMLAMMMTFASAEGDSRVYVAASGKAGNTGSAVAPLADLQEAKKAVRALPRNQPIQVIVSSGTYYLDKPLVFSAVDSGTEGAPVKWQAAEGAVVRLVGGKALKPVWEKQTDKIWKSKVSGCPSIDQLFVNENRQILARYPNYDPSVKYFCGAGATWERMDSWKNPETAFIHALHRAGWGGGHIMLERDKEGTLYERMVSIDTTTQGNRARLHDERRFAENVFEELDAPGEWFFDAKTQTLYYQPAAGVDLKSAKVEAVFNPHLVVFEGSKKSPVHHMEFGGFIFNGTSPTWKKTTEHLPNGGDFVVHRGGALTMRGTEDCRISNCVFSELGGNAVFIDGYNRRAKVDGNLIKNIGANGISLCGAADSMRGKQFFTVLDETFKNGRLVRNKWVNPGGWSKVPDDLTPGPQTDNYPSGCVISNNLITVVGELEKQTAAVLMSMTMNNTISHNTAFKLPRAGICLNDGSWGGHVIAHNDVFDTVRETADHGPFNSWGKDRFHIWADHSGRHATNPDAKKNALIDAMTTTHIRNNRFAHPLHSTHSWGIDLDDGSTNYKIYNNLTLGCAVKMREGFYRTVENNVFICSSKNIPGKHVCFPGNDDIYRKNIVVNPVNGNVWGGISHSPQEMKELDYNLYYTPGNKPQWHSQGSERGRDQADWQKEGMEVHSVVGDPLFIDPSSGDFRVKSNSPAVKLGFQNFPMDRFGVTSPGLKAMVPERDFAKYLKQPEGASVPSVLSKEKKIPFFGGLIKNMTTEAEKSAVGIGKITGVLVMESSKGTPLHEAGLSAGDLIIKCNGKTVDSIKTLLSIVGEVPPDHTVELLIHDDSQIRKYTLQIKGKLRNH